MHKLQLSQFMTRDIETLPPEASLRQLVQQMRGQRLSCIVIVEERRPVGIVSERDCVRVLAQALEGGDVDRLFAGDVMTSPVISVRAELSWHEALELVRRRRIRRLPVVDETGELVGLVTQSDLLEAQKAALQCHREELEVAIAERTRDLTRARDEAETALHGNMEFLATMTHEIRTPLSGVISVAELLQETPLTRQQEEWARTITNSGRALSSLVTDILDYAKMEASQVEVEQISFGLLEILEEIADLSALKAQSKGVEFRLVYDPTAPTNVVSDPARIRQLVTNLCGNAVKFTEKGEISLHAHIGDRGDNAARLRVEVRDTGIGIPADRQARLFQAYSQADASISRRFGGTGLGLAISRKLVEALGGEIGVTSTPGVGSTFWFELDIGLPDVQIASLAPASAGDQVVAVIDPKPSTATDLRRMLGALGVHVPIFPTAAEALATVQDGAVFAAVLVRFPLASRNDKRALDELRASIPSMAAYLVTNIADHALAAGMAHHGYAGALTRPVKRRPLRDALASVLDLPELVEVPTRALRVQSRLARGNYRLLLAEDNKVNQMVVQQQLRKLGFECTVVSDGQEAVSAFRERNWDLILMDNRMPLMDGPAATREIRRIERERAVPPIKIIALTASGTSEERDACSAAGMDALVTKPIQLEELDAVLDANLNLSRGRTLSPMQADALGELINIGVGRGAAELSTMLDMVVELSVPKIETLVDHQLAAVALGLEGGAWSCVQLGFDGPLEGSAALLFSERGAKGLVGVLDTDAAQGDSLDQGGQQTLTEVGNIVLNALVGSFANILEQSVRFEVPRYVRGSISRMMASDLYFGAHTLLMARMHFVVRELAVEGIVLVVLGLQAFERLLGLIEDQVSAQSSDVKMVGPTAAGAGGGPQD